MNQSSLNSSNMIEPNRLSNTSTEVELKQKLKELREENLNQNDKIKALSRDNENLSKVAIETKVKCADLNLENDELAFKLQQKSEQLKIFSA
jgi:hypothetical protein